MTNTGYRQATIAYKVSDPGGEPLDVKGNLCRLSGSKQAIALLKGTVNPNPNRYEVELYYDQGAVIGANPTLMYDRSFCPAGYIRISPVRYVLDDTDNVGICTLESSHKWELISGPVASVNVNVKKGRAGKYFITFSRIPGKDDQGYFTFRNQITLETVSVYIASVSVKEWILKTGKWNMLGFWYNTEKWKN